MKWYETKWATWLFLVLFFPVGLFLLWKYSNYCSTAKKVITGIFVLLIAVSAFFDNSTKNTNQPTHKVEQQNENKPALVGEEAEKAKILEIVKNSAKYADFRDATITKIYDADRYNIVVLLNGKDNLTTNMVYNGYKLAARDMFKDLYTSQIGNKINDVKVSIYENMIDGKTGRKFEAVSYMLAMNRERANQMHWENINAIDVENAATEIFIHPALQNDLNKQ